MVKITFNRDGTVKAEPTGYKGAECRRVTELLLGPHMKTISDHDTPEMHESEAARASADRREEPA